MQCNEQKMILLSKPMKFNSDQAQSCQGKDPKWKKIVNNDTYQ